MKKKTYKALNNRYYNALKKFEVEKGKRIAAEDERDRYKDRAEYYGKRFREMGRNVKTIGPDGAYLVQLQWEIRPEPWGEYMSFYHDLNQMSAAEAEKMIKGKLTEEIARGLIENDIVQFIAKSPDLADPLNQYGTYGGKLYVIPWEQMPHRRTTEIYQYVENTLEEGEQIR